MEVLIYLLINSYAHASLFTEGSPIWEALNQIEPYLNRYSLGKIEGSVSKGAHLIHPELISIGEGTVVEDGAYICGPCIIGPNSVIRHGAYIRGNVISGEKCVIGHCTEVKNSILLDNVKAAHFAYLGDSILGNGVNLGAGTKCANLRLDQRNIFINGVDTKRYKLGAILGDEVQTGCNSVLNPGTVMGKRSICHPCSVVSGIIGEKEVVC